jgi:hypothetical protein
LNNAARLGKRLVIGVGLVALVFGGLSLWNKHNFCRGWAEHYSNRAKELRAQALTPGLSAAERKEHLVAAELHDLIGQKYAAVAKWPFRPYPGRPLASPRDVSLAAAKYQ